MRRGRSSAPGALSKAHPIPVYRSIFLVGLADFPLNCKEIHRAFKFFEGATSVLFSRSSLAFILSAALIASPALGSSVRSTTTGSHARGPHKAASRSRQAASRSRRPRGQQAIEPARVAQIQQALIREHYFTGEANGNWDAATVAAMQKYQADQGWQTKLMPDSRALKKLGLGPDYSTAINAKDSSFANPPPASTIPPDLAAGFAQAAGVNR